VPVARALSGTFSTDAHFAAYASENGRRLGSSAVDAGLFPEMTSVVLDVDYALAHSADEEVPEAWRRELCDKVRQLDAVHPGAFYYETRGGGRVVYLLPKPFRIEFGGSARQWKQTYAVCLAYVARRFGIEADPACSDWTRLYRLPFVVRDDQEERRPTFGDPLRIGKLSIATHATDADLKAAHRLIPKAFATWKKIEYEPNGDLGLFFYLLQARGWIVSDHPTKDIWLVRCPNEGAHSKGSTGDSSTVLYPACVGKELGAIHCKHTHCENIMPMQWLNFFTEDELFDAQDRAADERGDG
jgi:hypothetical protein